MTSYGTKPETVPEVSSQTTHATGPQEKTLVFGCGYLGKCVAKSLLFSGERVWATTRSPQRADALAVDGIEPVIADWCDPATLGQLPTVNKLLIAVSFDRNGAFSRRQSQIEGLQNLLHQTHHSTRLCYISTTGVYHQTDGRWVDESSPAIPVREGGQVHLEAESFINAWPGHSTVLRLSGIYGPGRVPRAADVIAGRSIPSMEKGYLNLIHVHDAARAVIQSWLSAKHSLYLVSDDEPVQRREFYMEIARQTKSPEPAFVTPETGSSKSNRSDSSKRIRNERMKAELLPSLRYPTYREGLLDVLGSDIAT
ncbi:MAG: SDR family oxidoreductase [Planctomycetota bacterium]